MNQENTAEPNAVGTTWDRTDAGSNPAAPGNSRVAQRIELTSAQARCLSTFVGSTVFKLIRNSSNPKRKRGSRTNQLKHRRMSPGSTLATSGFETRPASRIRKDQRHGELSAILVAGFRTIEKPVVTNADGTTRFSSSRSWVRVPPAPLSCSRGNQTGAVAQR